MIIFGLGNPGLKYRLTRHNAGHIFVDQLARASKRKYSRKRNYSIASCTIRGKKVLLIKPRCWMNECGEAIARIRYTVNHDFLVVLDDINLPLGRMRLRSKGSDGGHLGLRSIINALHMDDFPRLRIGIGSPSVDSAEYVLEKFSADERKVLKKTVEQGIKGIKILVGEGFVKAQNYINSIHIELDADGFNGH
jgi:PTH1 family peptidyl-tRNA hydrolase